MSVRALWVAIAVAAMGCRGHARGVPEDLVGDWAISSWNGGFDFYDDNDGSWSQPNGSGFALMLDAEGGFVSAASAQVTVGACTTESMTGTEGWAWEEDGVLGLESKSGDYWVDDSCGSGAGGRADLSTRTYEWEIRGPRYLYLYDEGATPDSSLKRPGEACSSDGECQGSCDAVLNVCFPYCRAGVEDCVPLAQFNMDCGDTYECVWGCYTEEVFHYWPYQPDSLECEQDCYGRADAAGFDALQGVYDCMAAAGCTDYASCEAACGSELATCRG